MCQLILHGNDDQIMPIDVSALLLVQDCQGRYAEDLQGCIEQYVHTLKDQGNDDSLAFSMRQAEAKL